LINGLLNHDSQVTLEIANSIWYRNDFTVRQEFVTTNQDFYYAESTALDFTDPATKETINNWVKDKTHGKIEQIVKDIDPDSFMFLINATYFKGTWRNKFDKRKTRDNDFTLVDGTTIQVPMMHEELDVNMIENQYLSGVELPYGKGNWSMFVLVPQMEATLDDLMNQMTAQNWSAWSNQFVERSKVSVGLPKFSFEFETNLSKVLKELGLAVAFTDAADFTGILETGDLLITDAKHKTFVEVNEEGTEAAAATSIEIGLTSAGNFFIANRPFVFLITEKSTGTILFAGRVMNPLME